MKKKLLLIGTTLLGAAYLISKGMKKSKPTTSIPGTSNSGTSQYSYTTRGYRNCNPLNIRISSSNWVGKKSPNTDGSFEQFVNMVYGYRAALKLIYNYISNGYTTVSQIISRWAPPSENNTTLYIQQVCNWSGLQENQPITTAQQLCSLVYAMARKECGVQGDQPNMSQIQEAYDIL